MAPPNTELHSITLIYCAFKSDWISANAPPDSYMAELLMNDVSNKVKEFPPLASRLPPIIRAALLLKLEFVMDEVEPVSK